MKIKIDIIARNLKYREYKYENVNYFFVENFEINKQITIRFKNEETMCILVDECWKIKIRTY